MSGDDLWTVDSGRITPDGGISADAGDLLSGAADVIDVDDVPPDLDPHRETRGRPKGADEPGSPEGSLSLPEPGPWLGEPFPEPEAGLVEHTGETTRGQGGRTTPSEPEEGRRS